MVSIDVLKEATRRVTAWETQYGIFATWHLDIIGLTLVAKSGGEHIEKRVSWFELEQSRYPAHTLERAEASALAGLSN